MTIQVTSFYNFKPSIIEIVKIIMGQSICIDNHRLGQV